MTGGGLTPAYQSETGQVVLAGTPTGAAGEAGLIPVPGLELVFDCADGRLARVVVDGSESGGPPGLDVSVTRILKSAFGQMAPAAVRRAATQGGIKRALSPNPRLSTVWSRLARLDFTRATSPVPPASPLWAAEAAQLARKGGLHGRARTEARRAAAGLAEILKLAPASASLAEIALLVADLAAPEQPDAARLLLDSAKKQHAGPPDPWPVRHTASPGRSNGSGGLLRAGGPSPGLGSGSRTVPGLQWSFDARIMPAGVFRPGLSPLSDLSVSYGNGRDQVIVEATLVPRPDAGALSRCRARLVDPLVRRVLASASFVTHGPRARAELTPAFPLDELAETWIEVVDDEHRVVHSERLHRIRRALRWADAALRAERRPAGLEALAAGQDWRALAASAWEHCRFDWQAAGDADRAYLADRRFAALAPDEAIPVREPVSYWAAELAEHPGLTEPAFLAEILPH